MPRNNIFKELHSSASRALMLTLVVGLGSAMISGAANADRDARYIKLRNCGGYTINKVELWKKVGPNGDWYRLAYRSHTSDLRTGHAVCFDMAEVPVGRVNPDHAYNQGEVARLRAYILNGESEDCDSTTIDTDPAGKTRVLEMRGTTYSNNGCRSKAYKSVSENEAQNECSASGKVLVIDC